MSRPIDAVEFEALYRTTARDVLAYVGRRTSGDAEEIVAETYAVAWRRRDDLPPPVLRRAWLFGVARTLLLAEHRRRRREGDVVHQLARLPMPVAPAARGSHAAQVVAAAVGRLAPAQAELLRLVAWEGLTPAEVAVVVGVRPGAARLRLHRARQALAADPEVRALVAGGDHQVLPVSG